MPEIILSMLYSIASINIRMNLLPPKLYWKKFAICEAQEAVNIYYQTGNESYGIVRYDFSCTYDKCCRYLNDVMMVNSDWMEILVLPLKNKDSINVFTNQIFYTHAIQRRMVQIHSSMIDHHGNGLLFLGPSGIGKTTMAELWNQYRGTLIINGDMNFVQETEEGFLGWGTPWHGSSPYCENTNVPVRALVVLKQADRNSIRELDGFEKVQLVSNNVIYPTWLENGMELCLDVLDHLLRALPVYELSCRPDEEAVALTEKMIFGENRKW